MRSMPFEHTVVRVTVGMHCAFMHMRCFTQATGDSHLMCVGIQPAVGWLAFRLIQAQAVCCVQN